MHLNGSCPVDINCMNYIGIKSPVLLLRQQIKQGQVTGDGYYSLTYYIFVFS